MKHTIIIDAGHGIETAGKRSPMLHDGRRLYEYEYNRKIANHLETLCKENGLNSFKICEDDTSPTLYERVKKANRYISEHPDEQCIFLNSRQCFRQLDDRMATTLRMGVLSCKASRKTNGRIGAVPLRGNQRIISEDETPQYW